MPEMAQSGAQLLCELQNNAVIRTHIMVGLENERLIDPVLLNRNENWWLFAGKLGNEFDHLFACGFSSSANNVDKIPGLVGNKSFN